MISIGDVFSLANLIPVSFSVNAEMERGVNNIRVTIQNRGFRTVHITDVCVSDENGNILICIRGGGQAKINWDNAFRFPKTLTRDEPCNCVLYYMLPFRPFGGGPTSLYVVVTASTGKTVRSVLLQLN